jgi:hypothetical protein
LLHQSRFYLQTITYVSEGSLRAPQHRGLPPRFLNITSFVSNYLRKAAIAFRPDGMGISQQEHSMGTVMVKCPDTGRDISTGIVADRASFNATPVFFARVYCPLCQVEHEWFAKEAWVCDSESQWAA